MVDWHAQASRLEGMIERNRDKAKHVSTMALQGAEVAVGAFGSGFIRARWGMPQIMGRDANLVVGLGAVALGLFMPEVPYTEHGLYVGVGMLGEKLIDYGRQAGTPSNKAGTDYVVGGNAYAGQLGMGTSAHDGLQHVLAARRAMQNAG